MAGRLLVHATAIGKVLIASLSDAELNTLLDGYQYTAFTPATITSREALLDVLAQTRSWGYALDSEENEQGVRCVAVPVWNHESRVIAALSLSTLTSRVDDNELTRYPAAAGRGRAPAVKSAGLPGLMAWSSTGRAGSGVVKISVAAVAADILAVQTDERPGKEPAAADIVVRQLPRRVVDRHPVPVLAVKRIAVAVHQMVNVHPQPQALRLIRHRDRLLCSGQEGTLWSSCSTFSVLPRPSKSTKQ